MRNYSCLSNERTKIEVVIDGENTPWHWCHCHAERDGKEEGVGRSYFREGLFINDDRYDAKTKNEEFPAYWVLDLSRTSTNQGKNIRQCLGAKDDEGFDTHVFDDVVAGGKTVKKGRCLRGVEDLTQEMDMARVVSEQARLSHVKCMVVRARVLNARKGIMSVSSLMITFRLLCLKIM